MSTRQRGRKRFLGITGIVVLLLATVAGLNYRPIASMLLSRMLLAEAARLYGEMKETPRPGAQSQVNFSVSGGSVSGSGATLVDDSPFAQLPLGREFWEHVATPLAKSHRGWLKSSFLDREDVLRRLPDEPLTKEALPIAAIVAASIAVDQPDLGASKKQADQGKRFSQGLVEWLGPAMAVPATKELLVDLLTSEYVPGAWHVRGASGSSNLKLELLTALVGDKAGLGAERNGLSSDVILALEGLTDRHWQAVLRHCDHPREKVRAGSLLLLLVHPSREICLDRARKALADPSQWVRLAAAGILAHNADAAGVEHLLHGFDHPSWEVRYWCGGAVFALAQVKYVSALRRHGELEPDAWVQKAFGEWVVQLRSVFPKADWARAELADLGLDAGGLKALEEHVGGRGCVVRFGYLAHSWGDIAERADIASAAKPFYTHFLFKALQDGRIDNLDDRVSRFEPRLLTLNAALGNKDGDITWRHLANQTSCYGAAEKPGSAFDYNDFNMALFFDTLFVKAFELSYDDLDKEVLHAGLTDLLECQDAPTFFAFRRPDLAGRVAISVRDHARFGLLYLHTGMWGRRNLISEAWLWVATGSALSNSIPRTKGAPAEMIPGQRSVGGKGNQTDHLGSYSFAWWTNGVDRDGRRHWPDAPLDTFAALGHGGIRACVVIPSLDLVVAWNEARIETREAENEALRRLVGAVKEP